MERKKTIIRLINYTWNEVQEFTATVPSADREKESLPDDWSAKDHLAHLAHWQIHFNDQLSRKIKSDDPITDLDKENLRIYNLHKNKSWQEVMDMVDDACQGFTRHVKAMSEDDLNSVEIITAISNRPLWRTIMGNTIVHALSHLSMLYSGAGDTDKAVSIQERILDDMQSLDESPRWRGTNIYNLACAYALADKKEKAMYYLKESLSINPELSSWASQDPDLETLRGLPEYRQLFPPTE